MSAVRGNLDRIALAAFANALVFAILSAGKLAYDFPIAKPMTRRIDTISGGFDNVFT
jgi:hypothetical protein